MCCHQPAPDVSSEEEHAFDEAAYEDSDTVTETEEEHVCIRAKCTIDDAKTIDEAVEKLNEFIAYLNNYWRKMLGRYRLPHPQNVHANCYDQPESRQPQYEYPIHELHGLS